MAGLWWFAVLGTIAGVIMVVAGMNSAAEASYVEDAIGGSILATLGGPLLGASLVAMALAMVLSHREWELYNLPRTQPTALPRLSPPMP